MKNDLALVFYYQRRNRYSFNALAGALEDEHRFNTLPTFFPTTEERLFSQLREVLLRHEKVILGISFFTIQLWETAALMSRLKKSFGKRLFYMAGGPHPSGDPKGSLRLGFDLVVRGEGEETLIEIVKTFQKNEDWRKIQGIAFTDENGNFRQEGKRSPIDLDNFLPGSFRHHKFGHIEITRGCPHVCYFCQTPYLMGGKVRHRSIETICRFVKISKEKNRKDIRFITPDLFAYGSPDGKSINMEQLEKLLHSIRNIIKEEGRIFAGSFPSEVRPENVNEETVALVKKYGNNDNIVIGAQSGSQRLLNLSHRGHSVEEAYRAVELTLKAGFKAYVDFIFGLPGETEEDINLTINMMDELASQGARIHAHTFMPLPQTPYGKHDFSSVDPYLKEVAIVLNSRGYLFGDWVKQEKMAQQIARYLKGIG